MNNKINLFITSIVTLIIFSCAVSAVANNTVYYINKSCPGLNYVYTSNNVDENLSYVLIQTLNNSISNYTFKKVVTKIGEVKVGSNNTESMKNLGNAINCSGGTNGVDYNCTSPNPNVYAYPSGVYLGLVSKYSGGIGNVYFSGVGNLTFFSNYFTDGNGNSSSCATWPNGAGSGGAFNSFSSAQVASKVVAPGDGNISIIEVLANTGPYYPSDFAQNLGPGYFYPQQNSGTMIYNFNGNALEFNINFNNATIYEWHNSSLGSNIFYVTGINNTRPKYLDYNRTLQNLVDPKGATIGDEDFGYWNDDSMKLYTSTYSKPANYMFSDNDSLGYSTIYVKMENNQSPSNASNMNNGIWASQSTYNIRIGNNLASHILNKGIFRGSINSIIYTSSPVIINYSLLSNAQSQCIYFTGNNANNSALYYSILSNCGHRGVINDPWVNVTFRAYNNNFLNLHLMAKMDNGTYIWTFKNNIGYNLYAGAFQNDYIGGTLIEDHNSFHLDPTSPHGAKAISFSTTGNRNWNITNETDFPSLTQTSSRMYATGINVSQITYIIPTPSKWTGYAYQKTSCTGSCVTLSEPNWPTSGSIVENGEITWTTVSLSKVSQDPQFISYNNLSLLRTSPLINKGVNLNFSGDYINNPIFTDVPDIGTYEFYLNGTLINSCQTLTKNNTYYIMNKSIVPVSGTCIQIQGYNITFDGFVFDITNITGYTSTGIYVLSNSKNITIKYINVSVNRSGGSPYGLRVDDSDNITVSNSYFSNSKILFRAKNNTNLNILNNYFYNAGDLASLYLDTGGENTTIFNNTFDSAYFYHIYTLSGTLPNNNLVINNNLFKRLLNYTNALYGIYTTRTHNNLTISNNLFTNMSIGTSTYLILVANFTSNNIYIFNNTFNNITNPSGSAPSSSRMMSIAGTSGLYIFDNNFLKNNDLYYNIEITDSTLKGGGYDTNNSLIYNNKVYCKSNSYGSHGIVTRYSTNVSVYNNNVEGCSFGLLFHNGTLNNKIYNNNVTNVSVGLYIVDYAINNTAWNNTFNNMQLGGSIIHFYHYATSGNYFPIGNSVWNTTLNSIQYDTTAIAFTNISSPINSNKVINFKIAVPNYLVTALNMSAKSNGTLINVTYNSTYIEFISPDSNLEKYWYLQPQVMFNSLPVESANVSVYNSLGSNLYSYLTNTLGTTPVMNILDYSISNNIKTYSGLYNINITLVTLNNYSNFNITLTNNYYNTFYLFNSISNNPSALSQVYQSYVNSTVFWIAMIGLIGVILFIGGIFIAINGFMGDSFDLQPLLKGVLILVSIGLLVIIFIVVIGIIAGQ